MPPLTPDIVWIEPRFAFGSKPYDYQREAVYHLGIRAVVTLHEATESEVEAWQLLGMRVFCVPTRDWVQIPVDNFDRVVAVVSACLHCATPVLLHCLAGNNRAPTFAAAVLCHIQGMTVDNALSIVKSARASAKPTPEQEKSLWSWYCLRYGE